jgi:glycosyltransferase involved in cell wall biosynthesis
MTPKLLVVSPTASHPLNYGNRNRVYQTANFFKQNGYQVDFVLYPTEGDWIDSYPPSYADMCDTWNSVTVIPRSLPIQTPPIGTHHKIDEWFDVNVGVYLTKLFATEKYDIIFVNYPFMSEALTYAPASTVKILDTHDVFDGRKEMLEKAGVVPDFFLTTADQETIAYNRADIVLAIKEQERVIIKERTTSEVMTVTFFPDYITQPVVQTPSSVLRVGFIGAPNYVNAVNMNKFLSVFGSMIEGNMPPLEFRIAGDVCEKIKPTSFPVTLLGRVKDIEDFYKECDVIIAPLEFSTGLKIKIGEAFGFGLPVVATENAYEGYPIVDSYHSLPNFNTLAYVLIILSQNPERLLELQHNSSMATAFTKQRTKNELQALLARVLDKK